MDNKIKPLGSILKTDKKGNLINLTSWNKIKNPWKECIKDLKKEYISHLGKNIHSIYIRGSVAKGEAISYTSDLDSFVVIHKRVEDNSWVSHVQKNLAKKYPQITKVEIQLIPFEKTIKTRRDFNRRFLIKVQSLCIFGDDISKNIGGFKPGRYLAKRQNGYLMRDEIIRARKSLQRADPKQTKKICTWIMKRILRTAILLVVEKEKVFTRDLYPSYKLFSKYYPKKEKEMMRVLELAVFPTSNKKEILEVIKKIGLFIRKEAKSKQSCNQFLN